MFKRLKEWYLGINRDGVASQSYELLQNEAFLIAVESLQESLLQEFVSSKPDDKERREEIYKSYVLSEHITQELAKLYDRAETNHNGV